MSGDGAWWEKISQATDDEVAAWFNAEHPTSFRECAARMLALAAPRIVAETLRRAARRLAALAPMGDVVGLDAVYVEAIHDAYVGLNQWATEADQRAKTQGENTR